MDLIFSRNERAKAQLLEDNNGRQYVVVIRDEVQNQISSNIFTEKRVDIYDLSGTSSTENSSLSFSLEDVSTSYPLIHNTTREKIFYRSDVEVLKFIDEDIFLSFESGLYRFNLLDQNLQLVYEVVPYLEDSATMALFPFETSDGFSFSEHHVVSADSAVFFDNEGIWLKSACSTSSSHQRRLKILIESSSLQKKLLLIQTSRIQFFNCIQYTLTSLETFQGTM